MADFSMFQTWLQCINTNCNHKADLLKEREFQCPRCGSLFDVCHNYPKSAIEVLNTRRQIMGDGKFPCDTSAVWHYKDLIMPYISIRHIVSLGEGNVPIVPAGRYITGWMGEEINLWIMLEGMTPTGSFKDFGMTVLMSIAKAVGIKTIACASTGDTSASAAAYAAAAEIDCVVLLPKGYVTPAQLVQPLVHGARVITLPGSFDDCMRVMQELVANYGVYPANSLNPARIEGHQTTVFEIFRFFNDMPNWISVPVGNGSNASSIGKALRHVKENYEDRYDNHARILGCQSHAASPLASSWNATSESGPVTIERWNEYYRPMEVGETAATAARIGNPVSKDKVMREVVSSNGAMEVVSEHDLMEAVQLMGWDGHFVCPQTGIALAGVHNAVRKGVIKSGDNVVVVSTANGLKFTDAVAVKLEKEIKEASNCETKTIAKMLKLT